MWMKTRTFPAILAGFALLATSLPLRAVELVMVDQPGCQYCARWTDEIGPIYPNTAEGSYAPLRRVRLGSDELDALSLARRVNFTPTFVLVDDQGGEMSRLEGYPGEDFFWGILERMLLEKTDYDPSSTSGG